MINYYRLNLRDQLRTLYFWLITTVGLAIVLFLFIDETDSLRNILMYILVLFVIFVFPGIILYFQYLFFSRIEVIIDDNTEVISVRKGTYCKTFSYGEIISIHKVSSYPEAEKRIHWMATDSFFYFRIKMKNQSEIIVTSLMTHKLHIGGLKMQLEKILFPIIPTTRNTLNSTL